MKIGLIVEGESEVRGLRKLIPKLQTNCEYTITPPLQVKADPTSSFEKIAKACASRIYQLQDAGISRIIILFDREKMPDCPGVRSQQLREHLIRNCEVRAELYVVYKNTCFENWLIADIDALSRINTFRHCERRKASICNGRADSVNASEVLGSKYEKTTHAPRILERSNPIEMAKNSRSFRRFLHVIGHNMYLEQSRRAVD